MENTWMPKVAGILDIVAGGFGILICLLLAFWFMFAIYYVGGMSQSGPDETAMRITAFFVIAWAVFILAMAIVAIIGGMRALRKKNWNLALAGSICAFFCSSPLAIAAIIFTVLSKSQFE